MYAAVELSRSIVGLLGGISKKGEFNAGDDVGGIKIVAYNAALPALKGNLPIMESKERDEVFVQKIVSGLQMVSSVPNSSALTMAISAIASTTKGVPSGLL